MEFGNSIFQNQSIINFKLYMYLFPGKYKKKNQIKIYNLL